LLCLTLIETTSKTSYFNHKLFIMMYTNMTTQHFEVDSPITALYKWTRALMRPYKYLFLSDKVVRSIFDAIIDMHMDGRDLYEIYTYIVDIIGLNIDVVDLSMAYAHVLLTNTQQLMDDANRLEQTGKLAEAADLRKGIPNLIALKQSLLQVINSFYTVINIKDAEINLTADIQVNKVPPLKGIADLETNYALWFSLYNAALQRDLKILNVIEDVQERLEELTPVKSTEPIIDMATHKYKVSWGNGTKIRPEDGIDIFNLSQVSFEVPYIQYNSIMDKSDIGYEDPRRRIYYGNQDDNDETQLNFIIQSLSQITDSNTIYFTIWTGTEKKNNQPRDSYITKCEYDLVAGTIVIPAPVHKEGEKRVFDRVAKALSFLSLTEPEEIHVRGYFTIEQMNINQAILADMILNDPLFQVYLYIDESIKSRADKKRHNIHYKTFNPVRRNDIITGTGYISNAASVSISLGNYSADDDDDLPVGVITDKVGTTNVTGNTNDNMIKVNVIAAETRAVLNQFISIFTRLLRYYDEQKGELAALYEYFIPGSITTNRHAVNTNPSPTMTITPATPTPNTEGDEFDFDEDEDEEATPTPGGRGQKGGKKKKGQSTALDSKQRNMKSRAPTLILKGYPRKCQCKIQPIMIEENEQADWINRTFIDIDGIRKARQIMPFPPPVNPGDKPRWLFVCPDDKLPRPSVKENPGVANSEEFPYVPCCGKTDELNNLNSDYYKYYQTKANMGMLAQPKTTTKAGYRMTTMKRLTPGRPAFIPKPLTRLLRSHTPNNDLEDFARIGVPATTNCLIHCISLARHDAEYMQLQTYEEKEVYCQNVRFLIMDLIQPYIYKQELYDMSVNEIKTRLRDNNIFLDPYLYYRGVEEFFDINLFVFNPRGALHPLPGMAATDLKENPVLEIPRSKLTHIRPYRNRPNVLILKHWGAEANVLDFPQCELIISRGRMINGNRPLEEGDEDHGNGTTPGYGINPIVTNEATYIFGDEMGKILYETMYESCRTFTTSIVDQSEGDRAIIQTRDSPLDKINWELIFKKYKFVGQQIDAYGKLRMFSVLNYKTQTPMCVCVPPSQPMNLPIIDIITPSVYTDVIAIMGNPSYIHPDGLWYSVIDYPAAVFVPTIAGIKTETIGTKTTNVVVPLDPKMATVNAPPPPTNLNYDNSVNPINQYRQVERLANVFLQLMVWMWRLSGLSVIQWMERYVVIDPNVPLQPTAPTNLRRKLPLVTTCEQAIVEMTGTWPTYFAGARIHLYSDLSIKVRKYLLNIERITVGLPRTHLKVAPAEYLNKMYTREDDFIKQPQSVVLIGDEHLNAWKEQQLQKHGLAGLITPIYHKLDISYATKTEPYLYQSDQSHKIYIVQNVRGGNKYSALNLCLQWYHNRINIGTLTAPVPKEMQIPYVAYGISAAQVIMPVENMAGGADDFMEILRYNVDPNNPLGDQGRYAAMLPII
jgi:hypothetical protein